MDRGNLHLTPHVVQSLYTEAMVLADDARGYFDMNWAEARLSGVTDEVAFSCESLKVTTRLMHCIAWLLNQKHAAEMPDSYAATEAARRPLGRSPSSDAENMRSLPDDARLLIAHSEALYKRLQRLQERLEQDREQAVITESAEKPHVHRMMELLQSSF